MGNTCVPGFGMYYDDEDIKILAGNIYKSRRPHSPAVLLGQCGL